ncbi:MAG: magnesium/cobalt efflux protein, partial [Pseudomonadota bacterium]|nr:magnesium/cobalt efflux protein [Pseudomonadota bacterium]
MQNKKNTWFDRIKDVLGESPKVKEDLLELLKNSAVDGVIDIESLKMIEGVFKVSEIQVREIMIPRSHITVV